MSAERRLLSSLVDWFGSVARVMWMLAGINVLVMVVRLADLPLWATLAGTVLQIVVLYLMIRLALVPRGGAS